MPLCERLCADLCKANGRSVVSWLSGKDREDRCRGLGRTAYGALDRRRVLTQS